ncbi:reverse transcriptase domain-containing protein [Tanacetum coccineum]
MPVMRTRPRSTATLAEDFQTRQILLRCDSTGDLYPVTSPSYPQAFLVGQQTWHQRLGHPGSEVLRLLVSNNLISCNKTQSSVLCHACQLGKHVRLPFSLSETIVKAHFDIIHSDLWTSPITSVSVGTRLVLLQMVALNLQEEPYTCTNLWFGDTQHPDHVALSGSLYGLKQAPRAWFQRFEVMLLGLDFIIVAVNLHSSFRQGQTLPYLLLYVDDVVLTDLFCSVKEIITSLSCEFSMDDLGSLINSWAFCKFAELEYRVLPMRFAENLLKIITSLALVQDQAFKSFGGPRSTLTEKGRKELCSLLKQNLDIFAWKPGRNVLRCIKDVQKLNGKLASLNRFLSKSAEKSLPFFKTLKKCTKKSDFQWTPEAEEAFRQMKKLIAELPTLTAPRENEELIIYLAAAKEAISAVLMTDREGRQIPVYFVSRTLRGPEVNYTPMEKLVLALLSASKRLKRYFQAHTVVVITNQPIKQLLSSSEISGRMLKWKFELEGYDIQYRPRTAIKGQILADFIVERPEEESPDELMAEPEVLPEPWTLFTDGSSCVDGSGAGMILTNPEGAEFTYAMRFRFEATNNEAEYEALIAGLRIAEQMGIKNLQANVDSRLVANQVNGSYIAKESGMVQYLNKVKTLAKSFKEFSIKQIPRSENKKADALSKIASTSFAHLNKQVLVEELKEKSINEKEILDIVEEEGNTWMTPICEYLTKEILPEDKKKARAVRRKAARYAMINGTLYKKSFLGPWLRCVGPLQANYVLREIHEGSCSMHSGPRSVVAKVIQTGYYWPTMHKDARNLIRECNDCQIHRPVPRNPQQNLTPITSPWPFYKWGIDIAGPFPEGPGKVKFLIVAIDYFTKWIEAKAVATITGNQVKKFVWDNIVCRFGLPGEIISDNGKQFRDNPFKDWCEKLCIRQCFASVKHPQANGLVERANRSLGEGIKARLDEKSKDWIEELPHVLWAHRTMIKSSNGETPFSLTYGTEAERREQAAIQEAKSKKKMEKYYNSRVRGASFKPGDMVYRSNEASHAKDEGKLGPKWEGPYEVKESLGKGAYKLKDRKGNDMPRTWNICNLKKCYIHEM